MRNKSLLLIFSLLLCLQTSAQQTQAFQDTTLTDEQRVDHLLSILTLDEKINLLSTDLGVPRLNIPRCGHYEGLHGLTLGGPAMWGGRQRTEDGKVVPTDCPTTIFPQSYGLGSTWDTDLVQKVAEQAAEMCIRDSPHPECLRNRSPYPAVGPRRHGARRLHLHRRIRIRTGRNHADGKDFPARLRSTPQHDCFP